MRGAVALAALTVGWVAVSATLLGWWLHTWSSAGDSAIAATALVPFTVVTGLVAAVIFGLWRRWIALVLAVVGVIGAVLIQVPQWVSATTP
ncbi:MAG: endonuclease/exonuclease/phosphatase family protein, partial [Gordonia sp. (in: high G+C Gram-positive bacteria)]